MNTATLLLEDGTAFIGKAIGAHGVKTGTLRYYTGMTGYQEVLTDPALQNTILIMANPHTGNYGLIDSENESDKITVTGIACGAFADHYSRPRAENNLQEELVENDVVGIADIDTRALICHIRNKAPLKAVIASGEQDIEQLRQHLTTEMTFVPEMKNQFYSLGNEESTYRVAVIDFGVKKSTLKALVERNCHVGVFPFDESPDKIIEWKPDGILLSSGVANLQKENPLFKTIQILVNENYPLFGIGIGHLLLCQSQGIEAFANENPAIGSNHPIKNIVSGKAEMALQSLSYQLNEKQLKANKNILEITHVNLNDSSTVGIKLKGKKAFSVAFQPEASPGPHDSIYLFDEFVNSL